MPAKMTDKQLIELVSQKHNADWIKNYEILKHTDEWKISCNLSCQQKNFFYNAAQLYLRLANEYYQQYIYENYYRSQRFNQIIQSIKFALHEAIEVNTSELGQNDVDNNIYGLARKIIFDFWQTLNLEYLGLWNIKFEQSIVGKFDNLAITDQLSLLYARHLRANEIANRQRSLLLFVKSIEYPTLFPSGMPRLLIKKTRREAWKEFPRRFKKMERIDLASLNLIIIGKYLHARPISLMSKITDQ